jgi:Glyoxalase-like domain
MGGVSDDEPVRAVDARRAGHRADGGVLVAGARVRDRHRRRDHAPDAAGWGEPTVWLQPGAGPKDGRNRNHPDLRTRYVEAEVERVLAPGARRADVGQRGDEPFVVLADPEGNESCILRRA